MARIYQARQRIEDKRWDYTVGSDEEKWIHRIGYCSPWKEETVEDLKAKHDNIMGRVLFEQQEASRPFKDKYHDEGHATPEEAEACYRTYLMDQKLELQPHNDNSKTRHKCELCDAFTSGFAHVHGGSWRKFFCDDHLKPEVIREFAKTDPDFH